MNTTSTYFRNFANWHGLDMSSPYLKDHSELIQTTTQEYYCRKNIGATTILHDMVTIGFLSGLYHQHRQLLYIALLIYRYPQLDINSRLPAARVTPHQLFHKLFDLAEVNPLTKLGRLNKGNWVKDFINLNETWDSDTLLLMLSKEVGLWDLALNAPNVPHSEMSFVKAAVVEEEVLSVIKIYYNTAMGLTIRRPTPGHVLVLGKHNELLGEIYGVLVNQTVLTTTFDVLKESVQVKKVPSPVALTDSEILAIASDPETAPICLWWLKEDTKVGSIRDAVLRYSKALLEASEAKRQGNQNKEL